MYTYAIKLLLRHVFKLGAALKSDLTDLLQFEHELPDSISEQARNIRDELNEFIKKVGRDVK